MDKCKQCGGRQTLCTDDLGTRPICGDCGHDTMTGEKDDITFPWLMVLVGAGLGWSFVVHFWGR
jgi:hypothetical protein